MKHLVAILLAFAVQQVQQTQVDKRLDQLEKERAKLARETDPVDRAKIDINISKILLMLAADSARGGDLKAMERNLDQYVDAIRDGHATLAGTGRDAHKKPGGFKDLEIALRGYLRQLDNIGETLAFDQRGSVEKAKEETSGIKDDLIKALFFEEKNAPGRKP